MKTFLHHWAARRLLTLLCLSAFFTWARAGADPLVVKINPAVSHGKWEGWGTSLAWWAKMLGDRDDLADLLFTDKTVALLGQDLPGLEMNIVRYNAGACSPNAIEGRRMAPNANFLSCRRMEGYWLDGKSEDPTSASWDWAVDAKQRGMLQKARDRGVDHFELFSNSPMWWMCCDDNPSGSPGGDTDNLAPPAAGAFATYLATIAQYSRQHWNITFTSIEPFNEPNAHYWKANEKQEGCHYSYATEEKVIRLLRAKLDERGLNGLPIAAADENTYDEAVAGWQSYDDTTHALIQKVNVHGYQGDRGDRDKLFRLVSGEGRKLWNSEYGENDSTGLRLAKCLDLDLAFLHPTAWCYWQPFDTDGWGFLAADIATRELVRVNPKYFVMAQYSRHIRPGMIILETNDPHTVAAYDESGQKLVLVLRTADRIDKRIDLSSFASARGPITRWVTEPKAVARYEKHQDGQIHGKELNLSLSADSVQTVEIENVRVH